MSSQNPLKSVISIGNVDDTSLALPSGSHQRSGQQRVLEQVQTVRRNKSKTVTSTRNGSASLSPTSPPPDSVFVESVMSPQSSSNGNVFFANGLSKTLSPDRHINRQMLSGAKRFSTNRSSYLCERSYPLIGSLAIAQAANTSRSEPELAWQRSMPKRSAAPPPQRMVSSRSTYKTQRSSNQFMSSGVPQPPQPPSQPVPQLLLQCPSQLPFSPPPFVGNGATHTKSNSQFIYTEVDGPKLGSKPPVAESSVKSKGDSGLNGSSEVADITMKEAVELLSNADEAYQHCGASYIQHNTYVDEAAKAEVSKLSGTRPLVNLLQSSSSQVSQTAAAALRNLSFKSEKNKEEIQRHNGITEAVAALKETDSVEVQKQLTGLLWNLSSSENLKSDLLKTALPVLVERVVLPYTTGPNHSTNKDPDVFFHTTGCLRNLSSAKQSSRQAMRKCRGLVDSLATYVQDCVDSGKQDDESLENCVCILHNLTFQLEEETPALFSRITSLANIANRNSSQSNSTPVGCFNPQNKPTVHEPNFDFPVVEESQPSGAGWLIHSKMLQNYLSLLNTSQREETQEACCGALQNLTAQNSVVSNVMSQTIVQKLNGLQSICPLIKSNKVNLQKNVVNLVGNLNKNSNLQTGIARKALPELMGVLAKGTAGGNESDDTLAMACQTASSLLRKNPDISKGLLNSGLIQSLTGLSQNKYLPKSSKAAALFLHNLWSNKDLQGFLKKLGMTKSSFVNDITTAALRSVQVVE